MAALAPGRAPNPFVIRGRAQVNISVWLNVYSIVLLCEKDRAELIVDFTANLRLNANSCEVRR